jgi:hypothetical protein
MGRAHSRPVRLPRNFQSRVSRTYAEKIVGAAHEVLRRRSRCARSKHDVLAAWQLLFLVGILCGKIPRVRGRALCLVKQGLKFLQKLCASCDFGQPTSGQPKVMRAKAH